MSHFIHQGDSAQILRQYPNNHFDSIITDPPYGIEFLGKEWDSNTGAVEIWQECLRVLKPGGFLLAFSAARTYHHLATNIESVGFEIRDQLMWLYASGFPKAQDIGKAIQKRLGVKETQAYQWNAPVKGGRASTDDLGKGNFATGKDDIKVTDPEAQKWSGWKTALKPAHEPIVMARKPFKGSTIDNVLEHGTGALNIDASRVAYEDEADIQEYLNNKRGPMERGTGVAGERIGMFDNQVGFKTIKRAVSTEQDLPKQGRFPSNVLGEIPDYQKYFYCPKVSRRERHVGFEQMPAAMFGQHQGAYDENGERYAVGLDRRTGQVGNNHPTVKPVALMRYLIQLVAPADSTILDPFCGSGSTGMAACELGHTFVGCELDPHYVSIANQRIKGWLQQNTSQNTTQNTQFDQLFE